jgi:cyclic pyranopterin phosphate synthase
VGGFMVKNEQNVQFDGQKLMYHVEEVAKWLKNETVAPIYVEIGPTSICNHRCVFCAFDYLKNRHTSIDKDVLIKTLKDMAEFGVKSIMWGGEGEPLAYPHLAEATQKAKEFGLDVAITSNGVLLTEEKTKSLLKNLSWIKFSIDGGTP